MLLYNNIPRRPPTTESDMTDCVFAPNFIAALFLPVAVLDELDEVLVDDPLSTPLVASAVVLQV